MTVGHGVILHGCTVADRCLIGMGAILLNGSSVGEDSIVAAGTLLPEGMAVPPRSLVMGSPGKVRRQPDRRGGRVHPAVGAELRRVPARLHAGLTALQIAWPRNMTKPLTTPARGMRDFLPEDVRRRSHVIGVIRDVYERYGFEPLETPAVENIETLIGKYGEEGDRLIFKILKRGEEGRQTGEADLALRYDLTVPLARVVAEYHGTLPQFFKRYQIQPVWRADRPRRGGSASSTSATWTPSDRHRLSSRLKFCGAVSDVLERLGFTDFVIRLNHRELLTALLDVVRGACGSAWRARSSPSTNSTKSAATASSRSSSARGVRRRSRDTDAAGFRPVRISRNAGGRRDAAREPCRGRTRPARARSTTFVR